MLNYLRAWRERGWTPNDAAAYSAAWQRFGGSVATHPVVVERLAGLAGIPVRYLGWLHEGELQAAVPTWGRYVALSRAALKNHGKRILFDLGNAEIIVPTAEQPLMVIAPHADDAEVAAFGLYRRPRHASIVTVTQGEIEADSYQLLRLNKMEATRLKGRLRVWDSLAIPLWGNLPQTHCVQPGYYCQHLTAMAGFSDNTFGSSASGEDDIRSAPADIASC